MVLVTVGVTPLPELTRPRVMALVWGISIYYAVVGYVGCAGGGAAVAGGGGVVRVVGGGGGRAGAGGDGLAIQGRGDRGHCAPSTDRPAEPARCGGGLSSQRSGRYAGVVRSRAGSAAGVLGGGAMEEWVRSARPVARRWAGADDGIDPWHAGVDSVAGGMGEDGGGVGGHVGRGRSSEPDRCRSAGRPGPGSGGARGTR